ncbi:hypothetical protein CEXT_123561 [Caerostris extrusa]|uniref:Uncharacterized protein n=1 Tax=Caerostris extrusa TaxID=172846 RepID=A0AAV4QEV8_CAEEX|nr:hypothetical protein CEXT_123561 [Caerostris extrusa]
MELYLCFYFLPFSVPGYLNSELANNYLHSRNVSGVTSNSIRLNIFMHSWFDLLFGYFIVFPRNESSDVGALSGISGGLVSLVAINKIPNYFETTRNPQTEKIQGDNGVYLASLPRVII